MTAQAPDTIIYRGRRYSLLSNPLEAYWEEHPPRPHLKPLHTANWRGYVAEWLIKSGALYLSGLRARIDNSYGERKEIGLRDLFPDAGDQIQASWFSGELRIPQGKKLRDVHMGYGSSYKRELILTIEEGKVVRSRSIKNLNPGVGHKGGWLTKALEWLNSKLSR